MFINLRFINFITFRKNNGIKRMEKIRQFFFKKCLNVIFKK